LTDEDKNWLDDRFASIGQVIDLKLKPICDDVEDHKKTLYGNGGEGIKIKLDRVEQTLQGFKHSSKQRSALWIGAALAGVGGIINLLIGFIK
jgi:hypothetical protein